jgi:putative hydrolase of the HAD superfamily
MVLFDYGQTLVGCLECNWARGREALMPYLTRNPRGLTAGQIDEFTAELFGQLCQPVRAMDRELHEHQFLRAVNGLLELEYSIPVAEQERILCTHCFTLAPMPHVQELLALLRALGVRTGVVSNLQSSEGELRRRIAENLPGHAFEFVIASSEYAVRKPDPLIFRLALAKAGLPPGDVWFCGDNPRCDVGGAHAAGMFPVWYEELTVEDPWRDASLAAPACPHLHIHDWRELIAILKERE